MVIFFLFVFIVCAEMERMTVCAKSSVTLRKSPSGEKIGRARTGDTFVWTGNDEETDGVSWWKFKSGEWASSKSFESCAEKRNICSTKITSLLNKPCGEPSYETSKMEKFRVTETFDDDNSCSKQFVQLENGYWIDENSNSFRTCYSEKIQDKELTFSLFLQLFPGLKEEKGEIYFPHFKNFIKSGEMDTCDRISAASAQIGHESLSFFYWEEIADGSKYEGRSDLGNTEPGDGKKFKGRGPIQITGRSNYREASKFIFGDENVLLETPDIVSVCDRDKCIGFQTTLWYFTKHRLNEYSDYGTQEGFDKLTKRINGGFNGKKDRDRRWREARELMDCDNRYIFDSSKWFRFLPTFSVPIISDFMKDETVGMKIFVLVLFFCYFFILLLLIIFCCKTVCSRVKGRIGL